MRTLAKILDNELLDMLKHDDDTMAFNELYNRHWDKLFNAAYKRLKSSEVSEEIVQDIFTDIWCRRKILDIRSEFIVYLRSAVKYRVINYIHKEMVKNSFETTILPGFSELDNSTEEHVIANDLKNHLDNNILLLPVKCREVYQLSRNEYQSNKAIARQLSISEKTVENQITRALKKLRTGISFFL